MYKRKRTTLKASLLLGIIIFVMLQSYIIPSKGEINDSNNNSNKNGPLPQVTERKFVFGIISNLSLEPKRMSFNAQNVIIIDREMYVHFTVEKFCNNERVQLKQTSYEGIMKESILCGFSIYSWSIHS